jgi:6-phosphogluconolactonase
VSSSPTAASRIWVGSYTEDSGGTGQGIARLGVLPDGSLDNHGLSAVANSPTYLVRANDVIYAVGEGDASVSAFRVTGNELGFLGSQATAGTIPCSLAVLGDAVLLAIACYGDGVVDLHPLLPNGVIGKTSQSLLSEGKGVKPQQDRPHAHDALELDATTVLTTDLGTDRIFVHSLDSSGLTRTKSVWLPAGSGPRDLLLHPVGVVFALTELSNELLVLERTVDGVELVGSVPLPGAEPGDHSAALAITVDGRFVFAGLRGSNRVSVMAISGDGRHLDPIGFVDCGGAWPRHLVVDGPYLRVANQLSNSIATFKIGHDGIPVLVSSLEIASPAFLLLD